MQRPFPMLTMFGCLAAATLAAADTREVRFDHDIRPILSDKCFHCHGPDEGDREADLRLDLKEHARLTRKLLELF